jgi:hypothetical protein
MVIAKSGGTMKSGSITAFTAPLMGATEVLSESMEEFIEGDKKKEGIKGNTETSLVKARVPVAIGVELGIARGSIRERIRNFNKFDKH